MHHLKLKTAVAKFTNSAKSEGATKDSVIEVILADEKGYTAEEAEEIYKVIVGEETEEEATADEVTKKPQVEQNSGAYVYPEYDLWKVEIESLGNKKYKLEAVKVIREKVKIEDHVAELLNEQSHNCGTRYYPTGTVTNGDVETFTAQ